MASLKSLGKVNPLAMQLAFDIKGRVRDLDLPPLSPYPARYSGYGIEPGVLNVNLAWLVLPNVQLSASHSIVFKLIINLTGKAVTSPFWLLTHAFGGALVNLVRSASPGGSAQLVSVARAALEKVAKTLIERSALKMTVVGTGQPSGAR